MPNKNRIEKESKYKQAKRTSAVQSGLYFLINDYLAKDVHSYSSLHEFLQNSNLKIHHSSTGEDTRFAFYLNLNDTDTLATLFAEKTKAHFSIDRDYIEFDQAENKMRMHYCHFTQEYMQANKVVHFYFDSLGNFIEGTISDLQPRNANKRPLSGPEIAQLKTNFDYANEFVNFFVMLKNDIAAFYANATKEKSILLKSTATNPNNQDNTKNTSNAYINYVQTREKAKKYADTNLIFTEISLHELLNKLPEETAKKPDASVPAVNQILKSSGKNDVQADLNAELDILNVQINKSSSPKFKKFDWVLDLLEIQDKLYGLLSGKNVTPKQAKRIVNMTDSIDVTIQTRVKDQIAPDRLTVDFLQLNFRYIENFIFFDFYLNLINVFTKETDSLNNQRLYDVCQYLFSHSYDYKKVISSLEDSHNDSDPKSAALLLACTDNENFHAFEMLLKQSVNLDVLCNNSSDFGKTSKSKMSLFNFLLNHLAFPVKMQQEKLSGKKPLSANETSDSVHLQLTKLSLSAKIFIEIMLNPEYAKGMNTDIISCSSGKIRNELIKIRTSAKKMVYDETSKIVEVKDGTNDSTYMSSLTICSALQVPAKIFNLLLRNTKAEEVSLTTVALCYGYYLNWFGCSLTPIDGDDSETLFQFSIEQTSECFDLEQPIDLVLENEALLKELIAKKINKLSYNEICNISFKISISNETSLARQCGIKGSHFAALLILLNVDLRADKNANSKIKQVYKVHCSGILRLLIMLKQPILANDFISYLKTINEPEINAGINLEMSRLNFNPAVASPHQKLLLWRFNDSKIVSKSNSDTSLNDDKKLSGIRLHRVG